MKEGSPEKYEPWWKKEDESELEDILFKATQEFLPDIDPFMTVEKIGHELQFTRWKEDGSKDNWRSLRLVITAALFINGNDREEFENYAHSGFRDYVRDSLEQTLPVNKKFVESLGFKVPDDILDDESKKKPN